MTRPALLVAFTAFLALGACSTLQTGPVGNAAVPEPALEVDLTRYYGLWYEIGRYENGFQRRCEASTATYTPRDDGLIAVYNTCRRGGLDGELDTIEGKAKVVEGSGGAKLKVSFFGPFYLGDYWVLDRADDYSWAIVGEGSGRYLWLMSRTASPSSDVRSEITSRAAALGYDISMIRPTLQPGG